MSYKLTDEECFTKYVLANERLTVLKGPDDKGWYNVRCPVRRHGPPLRMRVGDSFPVFYHDIGKCPDTDIFAALVREGIPGEVLKRPKGSQPEPARKASSEADGKLSDAILDIAFGDGSPTDRMVAMVVAALGGEFPEGPMVGVFAEKLRVSERTLYRATAEVRRRNRSW